MNASADSRMYWVRNLDALQSGERAWTNEVELASEKSITGLLDYHDGAIRCYRLAERDTNGLIKYLLELRLAEELFDSEKQWKSASKKGYIFEEGIAGELSALLSFYFEARFFPVSSTLVLPTGGMRLKTEYPLRHAPCSHDIDSVVFKSSGKKFSDSAIHDFLATVSRVRPADHQGLAFSFHHYARGLREIGVDEEMMFVRLVSAVEAVSQDLDLREEDVLFGKVLKDLVRPDALNAEELNALQQTFDVRKAGRKFVKFLDDYSKGFFKGGQRKAKHAWVSKSQLPSVARAIYKARSDYLHSGYPMYLSLRHGDWWQKWDTAPSLGATMGDRYYTAKQKLPYPHFFHRLVRHCVIGYIEALLKEQTGEGGTLYSMSRRKK